MMMMMRRFSWVIVGAALAMPMAATAQMDGSDSETMNWQAAQVADFETMRDKFLALADAFPEGTWDWSPMEGVRSVKDVMALMVAEGNLFPNMWGATAPAGAASGFGPEMERVGAMSKAAVIGEMEKSFEHLISSTRSLTMEELMADGAWFGTAMSTAAVISSASGDMHEHLGQSIAYARSNQIVPPWSR
jgi:hypothetical protein